MPITIETADEWMKRNNPKGEPPISIDDKGTRLLPNGAFLMHNERGPEFRQDPPADKKGRLLSMRQYRTEWLKIIQRDFQRLKDALLGDGYVFQWPARRYGAQPADGKAALARLKELSDNHKAELAKIDGEINSLPEVIEVRKHRQRMAELDEARRAMHFQIEAEVAGFQL